MLPQHEGVPNFNRRISAPILLLFGLVLFVGLMLTLSFYLNADPGDLDAQNRVKLSLIITLLLSFFVLLTGSGRLWHPHLWKHGNSKRQYRHRRGYSPRRHRR
jgi:magnesium-transporting ATPase (P-type)